MTCRCPMCGPKNAGRIGRGSYVRAHVRVSESGVPHAGKVRQRKLRRLRENRTWREEYEEEREEAFQGPDGLD